MTTEEPLRRRRFRRDRAPRTVIDLGKPLRFDETPDDPDGFVPLPVDAPGGGPSRLLVFALVAAIAFAGGAAVQKRETKGYLPPAAGLAADLEAQERAAQAAKANPAAESAPGPTIDGTVVSVTGGSVVVRDAQGVEHTVRADDSTAVRRRASYDQIEVGRKVTVSGPVDSAGRLAQAREIVAD